MLRLSTWSPGASVCQDAHEKTEGDHTSPGTCLSQYVPEEFKDVEGGGHIALKPQYYQFDNPSRDSEIHLIFSCNDVLLDRGTGVRAASTYEPVITAVVSHQLTLSPQEVNADIKRDLRKGIRQFGRSK